LEKLVLENEKLRNFIKKSTKKMNISRKKEDKIMKLLHAISMKGIGIFIFSNFILRYRVNLQWWC